MYNFPGFIFWHLFCMFFVRDSHTENVQIKTARFLHKNCMDFFHRADINKIIFNFLILMFISSHLIIQSELFLIPKLEHVLTFKNEYKIIRLACMYVE